ncbi:unnamed protein product [Mycena citricolor]|uniref:Uncharacterized protein n=1 Tax=Mycena citricolor TaxID=2018698 RepID=A0AAD2HP69_9AGAR|nr:unnamed protein product [Mycena citricolor]
MGRLIVFGNTPQAAVAAVAAIPGTPPRGGSFQLVLSIFSGNTHALTTKVKPTKTLPFWQSAMQMLSLNLETLSLSTLFSRFASPSICLRTPILSLCIAPFLFSELAVDYREFLRWMMRGYKKKLGHPSEKLFGDVARTGWWSVLWTEVIFPVAMAIPFVIAFMFVKSFPDHNGAIPAIPLVPMLVISRHTKQQRVRMSSTCRKPRGSSAMSRGSDLKTRYCRWGLWFHEASRQSTRRDSTTPINTAQHLTLIDHIPSCHRDYAESGLNAS